MTESAATAEPKRPDPNEVTLRTIREWVGNTVDQTWNVPARSHAAGVRYAARCVKAILDVHGKPPDCPVHFPAPGDDGV